MKKECIEAVARVYGRTPTDKQISAIKKRLSEAQKDLARKNRDAWRSMSESERVVKGAERAAEMLREEAEAAIYRTKLNILKVSEMQEYVADGVARGYDKTPLDRVSRMFEARFDGKDGRISFEHKVKGEISSSVVRLGNAVEKVGTRFFGLIAQKENEKILGDALIKVNQGQKIGVDWADDVAKAFLDEMDAKFDRMKSAGLSADQIEDHIYTQSWSKAKLSRKSVRHGEFVDDLVRYRQKSFYVKEDGTLMSDAEVRKIMMSAADNIIRDGVATKDGNGLYQMRGTLSGRESRQRVIRIDPAHRMEMQAKWGDKGVFQSMVDQVVRSSRLVAALEAFGPGGLQNVRKIMDDAYEAVVLNQDAPGAQADVAAAKLKYNHVAQLADWHVNGVPYVEANNVVAKSARVSRFMSYMMNLKFSAILAAISDPVTSMGAAVRRGYSRNLAFVENWAMTFGADRDLAKRAGAHIHTVMESVNRLDNMMEFDAHGDKLNRAHNFLFRTLGINHVTESARSGAIISHLNAIYKDVSSYGTLKDFLREGGPTRIIFEDAGVSERDFQIWKLAKPERSGLVGDILTPAGVREIPDADIARVTGLKQPASIERARQQAAGSLMGSAWGTASLSVNDPQLSTSRALTVGTQPGSTYNEIAKTLTSLLSFPTQFVRNQMVAPMSQYGALGGSAYAGATAAGMMMAYMMYSVFKDLADGKDPRSYNPEDEEGRKNLVIAASSALPFVGDVFVSQYYYGGDGLSDAFLGGGLRFADETISTAIDATSSMFDGENDTDPYIHLVNYAKETTPLINNWYFKGVFDTFMWRHFQNMADPNYLKNWERRMEGRGTSFYVDPSSGEAREPDLETFLGDR